MSIRFHSHQFTAVTPTRVYKQNLQPVPASPVKIKKQQMISHDRDLYVFEYVDGITVEAFYDYGKISSIINEIFNLFEQSFKCVDGQWFSWLDDYNPSNFIINDNNELVVIDWLEAQWFLVDPRWIIAQMKKMCWQYTKNDSDLFVDSLLKLFVNDKFKGLVAIFDDIVPTDSRIPPIPMRSAWMYPLITEFRMVQFVDCQQYRMIHRKENDDSFSLGHFDSLKRDDPIWYDWILKNWKIITEATKP